MIPFGSLKLYGFGECVQHFKVFRYWKMERFYHTVDECFGITEFFGQREIKLRFQIKHVCACGDALPRVGRPAQQISRIITRAKVEEDI